MKVLALMIILLYLLFTTLYVYHTYNIQRDKMPCHCVYFVHRIFQVIFIFVNRIIRLGGTGLMFLTNVFRNHVVFSVDLYSLLTYLPIIVLHKVKQFRYLALFGVHYFNFCLLLKFFLKI